ncbi:MCE family protein [Nocardia sp. NPDC050710]|uniref:MCE family protein n=1 Tax=Nocardia sp. NPDC050710 TaxID=3157220 RepID=UPI0033C82B4D
MVSTQWSTSGWRAVAHAWWQLVRLKLAGVASVLALAAVIVLALSMYAGRFTPMATVTVETSRSGLVLEPDARVKFRGVEIGRVAAIERGADRVRLRLAVGPEQLRLVPDNARVDIRSTTVFGGKYVNIIAPERPSATHWRPGTVVRAESVTVEFNTLFEHLTALLAKVDPGHLNATLAALGTALQGRGVALGELLARADAVLRELDPSLPALQRDMAGAARVTELYADTADDLVRTTDNATVTGASFVDGRADLDAVLLNLIGLADTTTAVLHESEQPLTAALRTLRPTTGLLNVYAPVLHCVVNALAQTLPAADDLFGSGGKPWVVFNAGFMFGERPYTYPDDLPKVNATGGPRCFGIDNWVPGTHSDYLVTDTDDGAPFVPSTRLFANAPPVFALLFAGLPGVTER